LFPLLVAEAVFRLEEFPEFETFELPPVALPPVAVALPPVAVELPEFLTPELEVDFPLACDDAAEVLVLEL